MLSGGKKKKEIAFGCSKKVGDTEAELERQQGEGEGGLGVSC